MICSTSNRSSNVNQEKLYAYIQPTAVKITVSLQPVKARNLRVLCDVAIFKKISKFKKIIKMKKIEKEMKKNPEIEFLIFFNFFSF